MVLSCFSPPPRFFFPSFIPRPRFLPSPPPAFVLRRQTSLQPWYLDVECNNVLRGGGEGEGIKFILFNSFDEGNEKKRERGGGWKEEKAGVADESGSKLSFLRTVTNCFELFGRRRSIDSILTIPDTFVEKMFLTEKGDGRMISVKARSQWWVAKSQRFLIGLEDTFFLRKREKRVFNLTSKNLGNLGCYSERWK